MNRIHLGLLGACVAWAAAAPCAAAVSEQEAAKLKTTLTPYGAERAGNKDGSIPPWEGGLAQPAPGAAAGGRRADPYADEKPLFSITAKNMAQYADKLPEGTRLMFQKNPDYRVDVYKTHRTFNAPPFIAERTARNAVTTTMNDLDVPVDYGGGFPFPVPTTGAQAIYNHLLRWQADFVFVEARLYFVSAQGKPVLQSENNITISFPKNQATPPVKDDPIVARAKILTIGPPVARGGAVMAVDNVDFDQNRTWVYLAGQRRVKMLPNNCCDTPTPSTGGVLNFDEVQVFAGSLKQFDWKLLGKKEMYIPYNSNRTLVPTKDSDIVNGRFVNPDHVRWELHRVWLVEATLKPGKRHIYPRSLYYLDEDGWMAVHGDRWDARGQLAKSNWALPVAAPDFPGTMTFLSGTYDHITGAWFMNNVMNERKSQFQRLSNVPVSDFNPDTMAGEGVR